MASMCPIRVKYTNQKGQPRFFLAYLGRDTRGRFSRNRVNLKEVDFLIGPFDILYVQNETDIIIAPDGDDYKRVANQLKVEICLSQD